MRREQLFAAFFFGVLLYLLYQFYYIFSFFFASLAWAALLALMFYPIYWRLVRLAGGREGLVAFAVTTGIILMVIVPGVFLTGLVARESVAAVQKISAIVQSGAIYEWLARLRDDLPPEVWERVGPLIEANRSELGSFLLAATRSVSAFLVSQAPAAAANVVAFVVDFFFTTFALFFFLRDGERMVRGFRDLIPMEPRHKEAILRRLYDTLSAVVQGTLLTAAVQGILAGIGIWFVGVPFAVLLGCATAFFSLLPMGGPVVWLGVVVYLLFQQSYGAAIGLFLWGALVVSTADNVIRPLVISGRTRLPTLFLFFGILGGLQAYGLLGVFLGPALIAILMTFLNIYREQYGQVGGATPAQPGGGEVAAAAPPAHAVPDDSRPPS